MILKNKTHGQLVTFYPTQVDSFPIDRTFEIESEGENGEESEDDQEASESEDPDDEEDCDEDCEIPDSEDSEDPDEEEEDEDEDAVEGGDGAAGGGGGNEANSAGGAAGGKNYGKKFMLKCDELDIPMQSNNTKARLEALLEAAGEWRQGDCH